MRHCRFGMRLIALILASVLVLSQPMGAPPEPSPGPSLDSSPNPARLSRERALASGVDTYKWDPVERLALRIGIAYSLVPGYPFVMTSYLGLRKTF